MDILNENEVEVFNSKFVHRKTLREIASDQGVKIDVVFNQVSAIRRKIEKDLTSH
jgi:hypothetical protein